MEILNGILESVNAGRLGAVMTILGALAFFLTVFTQFGGFVSAIASWKIWGRIWRWTGQRLWRTSKHQYFWLLVTYRRKRAKRVMAAALRERQIITVNVQAFEQSLAINPRSAQRFRFRYLMPEKPEWLNDYYVADALETLRREDKAVKARDYDRNGWWPPAIAYRMWPSTRPDLSAEEFETNGLCRAYQHFNHCPFDARFEEIRRVETVAVDRTLEEWTYPVREAAPPCERCWEEDDRRWQVQQLVRRLTDNDFWPCLAPNIRETISQFQEQISEVCVEHRCEPDVQTYKLIVERAIDIRRQQLDTIGLGGSAEWTEQQSAEFSDALSDYVGPIRNGG